MLSKAKQKELEHEIFTIWRILQFAEGCFNYSRSLSLPKLPEEREFVNKSHELKFIRYSMWRLSVIEISKLYRQRNGHDKFNIHKFISKLEKGGHYCKAMISDEKINTWKLQLENHDQLIKELLSLRDEVYAHTDSKIDDYINDITFVQFEELIRLVQSIISEFYLVIFGVQIEHSNAYVTRISILEDLTKYEQLQIRETRRIYGLEGD